MNICGYTGRIICNPYFIWFGDDHYQICCYIAKQFKCDSLSEVAKKHRISIHEEGVFPVFKTGSELYKFINVLNNYRFIKL